MEEEVKKGRKAKEEVVRTPDSVGDHEQVLVEVSATYEKGLNGAGKEVYPAYEIVVTGAAWNVASKYGTVVPAEDPFSTVHWRFKGVIEG